MRIPTIRGRRTVALRFQGFTLDLKPLGLSKYGRTIPLKNQALRLLELLCSHQGNLVTHDDVRLFLWRDRTVSFNNSIHLYVSQIRSALNDDAHSPAFIQNVPGQGYIFLPRIDKVFERRGLREMSFAVASGMLILTLASFVSIQYAKSGDPAPLESKYSAAAIDSYRRGQFLLGQGSADANERSIRYFEDALNQESEFAEAHLGIARALGRLGLFDKADERAQQALELNDGLTDAYIVAGLVELMYRWDWDAARENLEVALEQDKNSATAHQGIATYYILHGEIDQAIDHMHEARRIDPASSLIRADIGWYYFLAGDYQQAASTCAEALELAPREKDHRHCMIRSLTLAGRGEEAVDQMVELMRQAQASEKQISAILSQGPAEALIAYYRWRMDYYERVRAGEPGTSTEIALAAAGIGDYERAMHYVDIAVRERNPLTPFIAIDPVYKPIRDDPRFREALKAVNLGNF